MAPLVNLDADPSLVDEDRGPSIFIVATVFSVLVILSTVTRLAIKLSHRVRFGVDDYLMVIALAFNLAGNVVEYEAIEAGFGRHLQFLSNEQLVTVKRLNQIGILMANLALWAIKCSVCFFLLSLIHNAYQRAHVIIYGLLAMTTISSFCQAIVWGLQARPLEKLWDSEVPGTLANKGTMVVAIITFTSINSLTDLFYALSPLYFFGRIRIERKKKWVLYGLTGSGLLVFAASVIRVANVNDFFDPDFSWALRTVYLCTVVERNFAELIADLPVIFPLLRGLHTKVGDALSRMSSRIRTNADSGTGEASNFSTDPVTKNVAMAGPTVRRADKFGEFGEFGAYGVDMRMIITAAEISEDEAPLSECSSSRNRHNYDNMGIKVQKSFSMQSHSIDSLSAHYATERLPREAGL